MIRRLATIVYVEAVKALRSPVFYAGPAVILLALLTVVVVRVEQGATFDYAFIAFATTTAMGVPALVAVLAQSSSAIASETQSGTIRTVLVRPIGRVEWLFGKWIFAVMYGLLLLILTAAVAWNIAWLSGGLGGVVFGGEVVYTGREMTRAYLLSALLTLAPISGVTALGIAISTLMRTSGAAVGAAVGAWLVLDAVKYPLHIAPAIVWTYWDVPWQAFQDRCDALPPPESTAMAATAGVPFLWAVVALGAAVILMRRRSL